MTYYPTLFHVILLFYDVFFIFFYLPGIPLHVCRPHHGNILGPRTAPVASHVDAAHYPLPHHGHPGLGPDLCSVHEGDQHDVHGRADDSGWSAAFQAAQESGAMDCAGGGVFTSTVRYL